jgi:hypothetical protein
LTNLEVPHGAGACTLDLCRFIWCGEYRSAVKVSTCNTNPQKKIKEELMAAIHQYHAEGTNGIQLTARQIEASEGDNQH